jgi:hypothetical protein
VEVVMKKIYVLIILIFLFAGCDNFKDMNFGKEGKECFGNGTCRSGLICQDRICINPDESITDEDEYLDERITDNDEYLDEDGKIDITVIFEENFESYKVNTFPSLHWSLKWNGAGNSYQTIVESESVSGTKSMQMKGASSWSAVMYHVLSETPDVVYFEGNVFPTGDQISIYLSNLDIQPWGSTQASIGFNEGYISYSAGSIREKIKPYTKNQWYRVKLKYDQNLNLISIWIDDENVAENVVFLPSEHKYKHITIASGHDANIGYFDDIKVWTE